MYWEMFLVMWIDVKLLSNVYLFWVMLSPLQTFSGGLDHLQYRMVNVNNNFFIQLVKLVIQNIYFINFLIFVST